MKRKRLPALKDVVRVVARALEAHAIRAVLTGGACASLYSGGAYQSATDSCRDRLAAFYHWDDRSSLRAALAIASRHRVDLDLVRDWSAGEGALEKYQEFLNLMRVRE